MSLAKIGDRLIVADYQAGIQVLGLPDIVAPQVFIAAPVALPQFQTTNSSITLGGASEDNSGQISRVVWSNDRGGGGIAQGTTDWLATNVALQPGTNVITATASDPSGNTGQDTLTVTYQPPAQGQTITFPALADKTFGDPPIPLVAAASSGLPVGFSVVSGLATVSNNVLTLTGTGTVVVRATQSGNSQFNAAPAVTNSFTVAKADQAIAFGLLSDKFANDPPFTLSATASSGLPVYFSIVSGPAVLDTNVVTLLGGGIVTVSAWQPGNSNYNAAMTVQRSFNVAKIPQSISFGPLSRQTVGDAPFTLSATASSGLPVSFAILSGPAVLSGNTVTLTGSGLVVLRASQAGDAAYAPAPNMDQVLIVAPGNNVITDIQQLANGLFTLRFYGDPGVNHVVQASTNLLNWLPLATNQISGLGYLEFTDTASTNYIQRFYRIAP